MNSEMSTNLSEDDQDAREEQLAIVFSECADRLNAGELLNIEEILSAHPDLADDLAGVLETLVQASAQDGESIPLGNLGDYTLRRQIGRGGMGVVYEAWQNSMDRQVALKVLPGAVAADDKAYMRFMREAKTAGKLNHQNIVHVHGMGVEDNTPYYAMLTGQSPRTSPRS